MAVSRAEMLGAASFSRRAGIPSSPVPVDVLSSLSWQWTNAADTGFKENKDWLELFKHASVLSWFHAVKRWNTRKQLFHNICKICEETVCNSKGIRSCFSIYCDRLNRSWRLRWNRFVGNDFLNSFPEILGIIRIFFYDSAVVAGFRFSNHGNNLISQTLVSGSVLFGVCPASLAVKMISLGHYFLYLVWQPRGVSAANFLFNLRCMVISQVQETCFEVQPRIIDILTLTEVVPGDRWQIFIKTCRTILVVVSAFYRSWFKL